MIYVAYYRNKAGRRCIRKITRGFACTHRELPNEIKIRCRASGTVEWDCYDSEGAADLIMMSAVLEQGLVNETGKD